MNMTKENNRETHRTDGDHWPLKLTSKVLRKGFSFEPCARQVRLETAGGHLSWMDDNVQAFLICYVFWHKRNHLTANIDFGVPESTQNNPQRNRIAEWNLCYRMGGSSDYMVSAPRAMHPKTNPGRSLQKVFFRGMAATSASHDQNLVAKLMLPWGSSLDPQKPRKHNCKQHVLWLMACWESNPLWNTSLMLS